MRRWIGLAFLLPAVFSVALGQEISESDTTVYQVAEEMPRFPGCENLDTTIAAKYTCSQQQLLSFIYRNVVYPFEARQNGHEGTVVVTFVVEKDGTVSSPQLLRNVDGGCGNEVLRVVNLMNEYGFRFIPGKMKDRVVRSKVTVPVRFKLEEAPPYILINGDSVWTTLDEPLEFIGGDEALIAHLTEKIDYPSAGNDSCLVGSIDVQILVNRRGEVRILNLVDYSNLGFDFWYEAIDAATSTLGKWKVATYQGVKVPASYELNLFFAPTLERCKSRIADFEKATRLINEGTELYNAGQEEAGIGKMTESVNLFPDNASFLLVRGQAYLNSNKLAEACADLTKARSIALVDWYDGILPVICR